MTGHVSARLLDSAPIFAALGDETRLRLVSRLCHEGPLSVVRLCEGSPVSRQAVTKHLQALSAVGLVRARRCGRERIYCLTPRRLDAARRCLDQIAQQWDDALGRLKAFVEE